jgi:hypothetical protein
VRRWPRISASSCTPPNDTRTNGRCSARDALAERGLAHPWRADEAQDRRTALRVELLHGQEFQDALLHAFQPEVVGLQRGARRRQVDGRAVGHGPGQLGHPLQPGLQRARLGAHAGTAAQARQFLAHMGLGVGRHAGLGDGLLQAFHLGVVLALFAQFLLDRLELLAQDEFAFAVLQLFLGALADLLRKPQHLDAVGEQLQHLLQPFLGGQQFQQHLLFLQFHVHQAGGDVGQLRGRARGLQRMRQFGRHAGQQREDLHRALAQLHAQCLGLGAGWFGLFDAQDARRQEGVAGHQFEQAEALPAVAHGVDLAVGRLHLAHHRGQRPDGTEFVEAGFVDRRVLLQHDAQRRLGRHRVLQRGQAARAPHGDGHQHVREEHHVAHGHQRHHVFGQGRDGAGFRLGGSRHGLADRQPC